jgi:hypothetical protein
MGTFHFAAEPGRAVAACGPVTLTTDDLINPRAFKHREHPLWEHTEVFAEATGLGDDIWKLRDDVWCRLVGEHLLPKVGVDVSLSAGSYNSAYARFVAGLTENEQAVPVAEVVVSGETVEAAFAAAAAGADPAGSPAGVARASTITAGLAGLVGRRVEVTFLGPIDGLVGLLLAVHPDILTVAAGESVTVVPLSNVAYVSTWQLTADEDQALLD